MASVEDILALKAARDNEGMPSMRDAALIGAAIGGAGSQLPLTANRTASSRMAGGLIGLILGGGLGVGTRKLMIDGSPAAGLLAKLQSGTFTEQDQVKLEKVLADTYSEMGLT